MTDSKPLQCRSANPEDSLLETSPQRRTRCSFKTRSESSKCEQKCHRINPVEQRTLTVERAFSSDQGWERGPREESQIDAQVTRMSDQGLKHSISSLGFSGRWWMVDQKCCFASAKWHFQRTYLKTQAQHLWFKKENGGNHRRKRWFSQQQSGVYTEAERDAKRHL